MDQVSAGLSVCVSAAYCLTAITYVQFLTHSGNTAALAGEEEEKGES